MADKTCEASLAVLTTVRYVCGRPAKHPPPHRAVSGGARQEWRMEWLEPGEGWPDGD